MNNCGDTEILHIPASLEDYLHAQGHDLLKIVKNAYRLDVLLPPNAPNAGEYPESFFLRPGIKIKDRDTGEAGYFVEGYEFNVKAISEADPKKFINIPYGAITMCPYTTSGRWYLAGPMAGYDGHNFEQFGKMADLLRCMGFEIVSPAELNPEAPDFFATPGLSDEAVRAKRIECLRRDLEQLHGCRGIVLLHGWEHSKGARLEFINAVELGLDIMITW